MTRIVSIAGEAYSASDEDYVEGPHVITDEANSRSLCGSVRRPFPRYLLVSGFSQSDVCLSSAILTN